MKSVASFPVRCLLANYFIFAACHLAAASECPLWGDLPKGGYAVGFRSLWQLDYSRTYNMIFKTSSYSSGKAPRPILVNIWYPANPASQARPMRHRAYLQIAPTDERLAEFARELTKYEHGVLAKEVMHKAAEQLTDPEQQLLDEFLNTPTACQRDAPPSDGKFPLVIYHAGFGSSFEDNSVLCEFLASHGFVVLGSAFQEPTGKSFNVDGSATSGRDMDFLIAYARQQLPQADWNHIAVVGHSGGAHAAFQYRAQPSSVLDAVVSLDTTQDYYSMADPRWDRMTATVAKNRENFTGPLLVAANPHAFFQMCDSLEKCERYYLTIKELEHNDFISQGIISNELLLRARPRAPEKTEKPAQPEAEMKAHAVAVRQGYEALCNYVLRFLEAYLKDDKQASEYVSSRYRDTKLGGAAPHVEYVPSGKSEPPAYRASDAPPPTPRQLHAFLLEHGADKAIVLLRRVQKEEPDNVVFHKVFEFALVYELLNQGKNQDAVALCNFYREANPDFRSMFKMFGDFYGRRGSHEFAISCYRKALVLDPGNTEITKKLSALEKSPAK